jgi:hypothetical protein
LTTTIDAEVHDPFSGSSPTDKILIAGDGNGDGKGDGDGDGDMS